MTPCPGGQSLPPGPPRTGALFGLAAVVLIIVLVTVGIIRLVLASLAEDV